MTIPSRKSVFCANCNMEFFNAEDTIDHIKKYHKTDDVAFAFAVKTKK